MNRLFAVGRLLFAIAMVCLGVVHLITGNFPIGLLPIPADFPGRSVLALLMGLVLVISGLSIGLLWKAALSALGLGILFLLCAFYPHVPNLLTDWYAGNTWTAFGELLALSGGAFYVAGRLGAPLTTTFGRQFSGIKWGRLLFVGSLVIFGILHFQYAPYIATLIPAWIPAPLFWAYFVGVAFIATAVSLLINRQRALSSGLLGVMFLLWVVLLHAPRVIAKSQIEPEWTSLFIALAMSGIAVFMAGAEGQKTGVGHSTILPTSTIMN